MTFQTTVSTLKDYLSQLVSLIWTFITLQLFSNTSTQNGTVSGNDSKTTKLTPISVNYHISRICNYTCGFCFHTAKTSHILTLDEAKRGIKLLKEAGMKKINFAGGEPLLPKFANRFLGPLIEYCKKELKIESVSIVTNGSQIKKDWFSRYGEYLDVLAISCDSFNEETNCLIGRGTGKHLENLEFARDLCLEYNIKFKINSVINKFNWREDMNDRIAELKPFRWKCFQVLVLEGENSGANALRDASKFAISDEQFKSFCDRHRHQACLVPESNEAMKNSYLILDEYFRFLDCSNDGKEPSGSVLEVGVQRALEQSGWDPDMFIKRGGVYEWSKESQGCNSPVASNPDLQCIITITPSMEPLPVLSNCITTNGGSKVNKTAALYGMHNLVGTKYIFTEGTVIRGDLAQIKLGTFAIVMPNCVIRPPIALGTTNSTYLPVFIGNYVYIGENSIVQANDIGNHVYIGKNCVIGPRCKLRDGCKIADNTVLPADTTVASLTLFSGNPGRFQEELPESTEEMVKDLTINYYSKYMSNIV